MLAQQVVPRFDTPGFTISSGWDFPNSLGLETVDSGVNFDPPVAKTDWNQSGGFSRLLAEHHPTTETQSCDHRT
jgi:hypothetical protein